MRHPNDEDSNQPSSSSGDHAPHYNPNQPRVPAGHHGGGEWTRGGFGHNDPIVRLAFEDRTNPLRRIDSPPLAPTQLPRAIPQPRLPLKGPLWFALGLAIEAMLRQNDPDQQPALVFRSRDYQRNSQGLWRLESLESLTQKDINEICGDQIKDLQGLLDKAVKQVVSEGKNLAPGPFGTRGHQVMEELLDGLKKADMKTEFLIEKKKTGGYEFSDRNDNPKDSLRLDLGQFKGEETACITDHKFGEKGLSNAQFEKMFQAVKAVRPQVNRILITEGKPTWSPLFKRK